MPRAKRKLKMHSIFPRANWETGKYIALILDGIKNVAKCRGGGTVDGEEQSSERLKTQPKVLQSRGGGTGRRGGLKTRCRKACEFDSRPRHHLKLTYYLF